jgi:hypothetical protein
MNSRTMFALGSGLLLGVAGVVHADTTNSDTDLKAQVQELKARVAELEGQHSQDWLNKERTAEVKALVKDVLSDADTRASLMANGMTAGFNNEHFFIASEDNNFLLNVDGLVQVRYNYDHRRDPVSTPATGGNDANGTVNADEKGFEVARTEIDLSGHIVSPAWTYFIRLQNPDPESSTIVAQDAEIGYQVTDTLKIRVGRTKGIFMRESLVDDMYQEAVDRSFTEAFFGAGYVQGLFLDWDVTDMVHLKGSFNNGLHSGDRGDVGYSATGVDYAVTGRVDVKAMGDWSEEKDYASWSETPTALFMGAAINYQTSETGNDDTDLGGPTSANTKDLRATADFLFKAAGANVSGAVVYDHLYQDDNSTPPVGHHDWYAFELQAGYMVIPDKLEPFVRYEYLQFNDGYDEGSMVITQAHPELLTLGVNYYIAKHRAKFTLDTTYAFVGIANSPGGTSDLQNDGSFEDSIAGAGLHSDQILVRGQLQLMF